MQSQFMLRKLIIIFMALSLSFTTIACGGAKEETKAPTNNNNPALTTTKNAGTKLADGKYPVQQATYDDGNGEYSVMLLNTPAGTPPLFRNTNLQMAQLTEEEVKANQKAYLKTENGQASLHIPADFKIEYVHNVTKEQTNPQTGQQEKVVVREGGGGGSFWSPFAGAIAGQVVGNMLFRPQHYMPPMYQQGGPMMGFGGYGNTYDRAVGNYQERYRQEPAAVRNRTTLRTTGRLNNSGFGSGNANRSPQVRTDANRSSGSGFGTSRLRTSDNYRPRAGGSSFGSSGARRSSGFGSRRR
jgi:hypothetical protein